MNDKNANAYRIVGDIIGKLFLVLLSGCLLVAVTLKLIFDPSWPVAAVDSIFASTVFLVFKHYFSKPVK